MVWQEQEDAMQRAIESSLEALGLQEQMLQLEAWVAEEAEGQTEEGRSFQAAVEAERRCKEWLVNKAALGWRAIMYWTWEHWILLDEALAELASIQDSLAQMLGNIPPELEQGVEQMGHLLVGH
ncbi:hypothetical protein E4T56_gene6839 [Termitomyces sp. T112]|nr:hypothetical protein E4T56_gene6839 [Termitomyces sp. T112]